ncbi:MAG: hypothetical protein Q4D51_03335 [Eubacteriales bacterium]|nr:hypothetical protein [Eubacteriales bacterium]
MENKKTNQATSFLMVVGIIFIVIAGTIFVSTTWGYLPEMAKLILLLLIGGGLHVGAFKMREKNVLRKTETAMYYLGSSFLAFAMYMGCKNISLASAVALVPVAIRFLKSRSGFDLTMTALLADWVVLWFQIECKFGFFASCLLATIVLTIYVVLDVYREKWQADSKNVEIIFQVFFILHAAGFVIRNLVLLLVGQWILEKGVNYEVALMVMASFVLIITTILYIARKTTVIRVFQSLSIVWLAMVTVIAFASNVYTQMSFEVGFVTVFVICAICMAALVRTELFWIVISAGMLAPFYQLDAYYTSYSVLSNTFTGLPYIVLAITLISSVGVYLVRKMHMEDVVEGQAFQYMLAGICQLVVLGTTLIAYYHPTEDAIGWAILTLQFLTIGFLLMEKTAKKCFYSFALVTGEIFAMIVVDDMVPTRYDVAVICAAMAIGVYMVGIIFQSKSEAMRMFQFICACIISSIMLLNALADGRVENALILGIAGVATLVAGAIHNSKRYVILSSIVLVLLVFYLTRHIWASIAWWVYLFVAGVGLVLFAIKKEKEE